MNRPISSAVVAGAVVAGLFGAGWMAGVGQGMAFGKALQAHGCHSRIPPQPAVAPDPRAWPVKPPKVEPDLLCADGLRTSQEVWEMAQRQQDGM